MKGHEALFPISAAAGARKPFDGRLPLQARESSSLFHPDSRFFLTTPTGESLLNLELPVFADVQRHVHKRLGEVIVRANVRNQELLTKNPFFARIGITTTDQLAEHMIRYNQKYHDADGNYYLPYDFVPPNEKVFRNRRFNWDTEPHIAALLHAIPPEGWSEEQKAQDRKDRLTIAQGEMRNAKYIFDCWGGVINATAEGLNDRPQPPRHTAMIRMIWDAMTPQERAENQEFFHEMWEFAKKEYWTNWNALDAANPYKDEDGTLDPYNQNVILGGEVYVRYGHRDAAVYHNTAALTSGHDHGKGTYRREADHTRIDLEMYLLQYEKDFAWAAEQSGQQAEVTFWQTRKEERINRVMKNHRGVDWFSHNDFKNRRQSDVEAVTGFLAYGLLPEEESLRKIMLEKLQMDFLGPYGLMLTTIESLPKKPSNESIAQIEPDPGMQATIAEQYKHEQWEGPNQFYNITSQVVDELLANGEYKVAATVIENVLIGLVLYYEEHGKLPEKMNVLTGEMGNGAEYGDQDELMMPAGVFAKFMNLLPEVYKKLETDSPQIIHQPVFDARAVVTA